MLCTIKLKRALQEFVRYAYMGGGSSFGAQSAFGRMILPLLTRPPAGYSFVRSEADAPDYFTFELPRYRRKNTEYNYWISPVNQEYLECLIEITLRQTLFLAIDLIGGAKDRQIKKAIYIFCEHNHLPMEYINYETLKKAYYRHKKSSSLFVPENFNHKNQ